MSWPVNEVPLGELPPEAPVTIARYEALKRLAREDAHNCVARELVQLIEQLHKTFTPLERTAPYPDAQLCVSTNVDGTTIGWTVASHPGSRLLPGVLLTRAEFGFVGESAVYSNFGRSSIINGMKAVGYARAGEVVAEAIKQLSELHASYIQSLAAVQANITVVEPDFDGPHTVIEGGPLPAEEWATCPYCEEGKHCFRCNDSGAIFLRPAPPKTK